jgi:hypothetical protein
MGRRGVEARFQATGSSQRDLLGLDDSASRQEGVGESVGACCHQQRLVDRPCCLHCPVSSNHGQAIVAKLPEDG